jgi:hypothetical protein
MKAIPRSRSLINHPKVSFADQPCRRCMVKNIVSKSFTLCFFMICRSPDLLSEHVHATMVKPQSSSSSSIFAIVVVIGRSHT